MTSATNTSRNGGALQLRYANGLAIAVNSKIYTGSILTSVGKAYHITLG